MNGNLFICYLKIDNISKYGKYCQHFYNIFPWLQSGTNLTKTNKRLSGMGFLIWEIVFIYTPAKSNFRTSGNLQTQRNWKRRLWELSQTSGKQ